MQLCTPELAGNFQAWWRWRVVGTASGGAGRQCAACGASTGYTAEHIASDCAVAEVFAKQMHLEGGAPAIFAQPCTPTQFRIQLSIVARLLLCEREVP